MTIFAGAFCLQSACIPPALKSALRLNLRSKSDDLGNWHVHDQERLFIVKWDSGAFSEPAWRVTPDGSVSVLAGDPLLIEDGRRLTRQEQMGKLAPESASMQDSALAQCRGSFALAQYVADQNTLFLATDAIGLRSIYYVIQDGYLVFASALRVLEATSEVSKSLSLLGVAELSTFSFPLAERTPYDGIAILRESEILSANSSGVKLRNYYDWSTPEASPCNPEDAATQLYATFREAVAIRLGGDKRVYSFLSGGMDSRAIVATLLDMAQHVEALNFSADESQDQQYAQLFAIEAGSQCRLHCLKGGNFPNFSYLALAAKTELEQRMPTHVDRPQMIWSGDGGSVGLGHVYMNQAMLDFGERGDVEGAAKHFLDFNRIALTSQIFAKTTRKQLPRQLFESVMSEVNRYPRDDIGRRIYLFLLFNDQRRHLFKHFETIDQHGLELLTPFFDAKFLKAVAATPSRWGVLHSLYSQLFEHLPPLARRSPWQTYPGHQPCPLPSHPNASYQWTSRSEHHSNGLVERSKLAIKLIGLISHRMQPQVFSQPRIWLAAFLHALGLRDCRHILQRLEIYRCHVAITQQARGRLMPDHQAPKNSL
jgi:asparagine synthase (glutamine-hydrolysing)